MIRLTIVTAVRNLIQADRESVFRQCVESVHNQNFSNQIEHLIVDGASADGTIDLITDYERRGWVRMVSRPDKSVYDGMNHGIEEAKGSYILFLNSDDYLKDTVSLDVVVDDLASSGADYCYGDVQMIYSNGHKRILEGDINKLPFAEHFCHQSMIVKTEVLRRFGGFDIDYLICADNDLTMRLFASGCRCIKNRKIFVCYRDGGISATNGALAKKEHGSAFYEHFGKDLGLTKERCVGLWYYSDINQSEYEDCLRTLVLLPRVEWRKIWAEKMIEAFQMRRIGVKPLYVRIQNLYQEYGMRGVYASVKRRILRFR